MHGGGSGARNPTRNERLRKCNKPEPTTHLPAINYSSSRISDQDPQSTPQLQFAMTTYSHTYCNTSVPHLHLSSGRLVDLASSEFTSPRHHNAKPLNYRDESSGKGGTPTGSYRCGNKRTLPYRSEETRPEISKTVQLHEVGLYLLGLKLSSLFLSCAGGPGVFFLFPNTQAGTKLERNSIC